MSLDTETGRDRYFAALAREAAELVDPETGLLAARWSRTVDCPLCGGSTHARLFVKDGYPFVRCADCALVFANPQVDESLVLDRYRANETADLWAEVLLSARQEELDRRKFAEILDVLEPSRGDGRILDVGCSIGLFLDLARERGWHGVGLELGERALAHSRDVLGLDVRDATLDDAGLAPASFDVVTLLSVLEHTHDPLALLADVGRVLAPGGALYVIVPNVESLACRVLHERAATFDGRNHLVYFSPSTLGDVLDRSGFEPLELTTKVTSIEPVLEWLAYEQPYGGADLASDALAREVRGADLDALLERLGLGYKLHCLARRRDR